MAHLGVPHYPLMRLTEAQQETTMVVQLTWYQKVTSASRTTSYFFPQNVTACPPLSITLLGSGDAVFTTLPQSGMLLAGVEGWS